MKKFLIFLMAVSFLSVGISLASESVFMNNMKAHVVGKTWYTTAHSNVIVEGKPHPVEGLKAKMKCEDHKGEVVSCKVYYGETEGGDYELWVFSDTTLDQTEFTGGKAGDSYGATHIEKNKPEFARNYFINCKDKERKDCDAGVPGSTYWHIEIDPAGETFYYIVHGPEGKPWKTRLNVRHIFEFTTNK